MNRTPPALPRSRQWLGLAGWLAFAFATAAIGAVALSDVHSASMSVKLEV
ncbi:MAG: hypothetical protein KGZ31_03015 [Sulfuritalea sp.]|nr:hypothetical protein [Sulfuritalea sp.]